LRNHARKCRFLTGGAYAPRGPRGYARVVVVVADDDDNDDAYHCINVYVVAWVTNDIYQKSAPMGDSLRSMYTCLPVCLSVLTGRPSLYVTNHLGQLTLPSLTDMLIE